VKCLFIFVNKSLPQKLHNIFGNRIPVVFIQMDNNRSG
jgi:hypothetical protein